ncbi:MAG: hypothetical protein DRJ03_03215 [Chloroflexi bacterium]|nr:MAG: hypothetical protein DRJ03_03215 [Chloroflexota bacterium]
MTIQFDRTLVIDISGGYTQRTLTDLQVTFTVTKTLLSYPNKALVNLYNLAPKSKALLIEEDAKIDIYAGYNANNRLIFSGDVRNVVNTKQGVDSITTVYAGDGSRAWEKATINKTFSKRTPLSVIITALIETFGTDIGVGTLLGPAILPLTDRLTATTLSGSTRDVMDRLAETYKFNWTIMDGKLEIIPYLSPNPSQPAVSISNKTGLRGSPTITEQGVEVKTAMNAKINPNGLFVIDSVASNVSLGDLYFRIAPILKPTGTYKVYEVVHTGDFRGNEWDTFIKGVPLERLI